jgi:hypothetical protein
MIATVLLTAQIGTQLGSAPLQVGDRWTMELRRKWTNVAEEFEQTNVERLQYEVIEATSFKATLKVKRHLTETIFPEATVPGPKGDPLEYTIEVAIRPADGTADRRPLEANEMRVERWFQPFQMGSLDRSVAQTQGWNLVLPPIAERRLPSIRFQFRSTGSVSTNDTYGSRIGATFEFAENTTDNPYSGTGAVTIHKQTGIVTDLSLVAEKVWIPGGTFAATLQATMKVQQWSVRRP